jgi:hypothetical protein
MVAHSTAVPDVGHNAQEARMQLLQSASVYRGLSHRSQSSREVGGSLHMDRQLMTVVISQRLRRRLRADSRRQQGVVPGRRYGDNAHDRQPSPKGCTSPRPKHGPRCPINGTSDPGTEAGRFKGTDNLRHDRRDSLFRQRRNGSRNSRDATRLRVGATGESARALTSWSGYVGAGTVASLGVKRQSLLAGGCRWWAGISVRRRDRAFHCKRRSASVAGDRALVATSASAATRSSGGSPENWLSLR